MDDVCRAEAHRLATKAVRAIVDVMYEPDTQPGGILRVRYPLITEEALARTIGDAIVEPPALTRQTMERHITEALRTSPRPTPRVHRTTDGWTIERS